MGSVDRKETGQRVGRVLDIRRDNRFLRWVEASRALERIEPIMPLIAQELGQLDVELIQDTQLLIDLAAKSLSNASISREERAYQAITADVIFKDQLTLSYLWVLGAYELVRVIYLRCRDNPLLPGSGLNAQITAAKHAFERLRIPLAKLESSRRHRDTDSPIAWPAIHREFGVSWLVAKGVLVSRKELSDSFLDLLEEMRRLNGSPRVNHELSKMTRKSDTEP